MNQEQVFKKVYLRQDDDCHWYVIPDELTTKWSELMEGMDSDNKTIFEQSEDEFNSIFSEYRTNGGPNNLTQLYIKS